MDADMYYYLSVQDPTEDLPENTFYPDHKTYIEDLHKYVTNGWTILANGVFFGEISSEMEEE